MNASSFAIPNAPAQRPTTQVAKDLVALTVPSLSLAESQCLTTVVELTLQRLQQGHTHLDLQSDEVWTHLHMLHKQIVEADRTRGKEIFDAYDFSGTDYRPSNRESGVQEVSHQDPKNAFNLTRASLVALLLDPRLEKFVTQVYFRAIISSDDDREILFCAPDDDWERTALSPNEIRTPFILNGPFLYIHRWFEMEYAVTVKLCQRLSSKKQEAKLPYFFLPSRLPLRNFYCSHRSTILTAAQQKAVQRGLTRPFSMITGGPGYGKSAVIIHLILTAMEHQVPASRIALAAPTGKAAQRLSQYPDLPPGVPSMTLHRLLEYQSGKGTFKRGENFPLDYDLVLVDEASMIDMVLMRSLLDACSPHTHLVLVGDPFQLPSVDVGFVFQVLVESLQGKSSLGTQDILTTLDHNFRVDHQYAAAQMEAVNTAVKLGDNDAFREAVTYHFNIDSKEIEEAISRPGVHFYDYESPESLKNAVESWMLAWFLQVLHPDKFSQDLNNSLLNPQETQRLLDAPSSLLNLLQTLDRAKILVPTRHGLMGTDTLNRWLNACFGKYYGKAENRRAVPFELVMVTENLYHHGLFNGETGVVLTFQDNDETDNSVVVFPQRPELSPIPLTQLEAYLTTAYTLTIHKSQGSEYDRVLIFLPPDLERDSLLTRELLYTAMTRCRQSCIVVGMAQTVSDILARHQRPDNGLNKWLQGAPLPSLQSILPT